MDKILGIDISYCQGDIDWTKLPEEIKFVFARVSYAGKEDIKFDKNWKSLKDKALIRAPYVFFLPDQLPEENLKVLDSHLDFMNLKEPGCLPAVLDVESVGPTRWQSFQEGPYKGDLKKILLDTLDLIESKTGKVPILYTGPYFWSEHIRNGDEFSKYPLWVAHYGTTTPIVPKPWTDWLFWQYSGSSKLAGVKTLVDMNYFNGDLDTLRFLANLS